MITGTQLECRPRWEFVMVRSGEEQGPLEGFLVGLSRLMVMSRELSNASTMVAPRLVAPFVLGGGVPGVVVRVAVTHDEDVARVVE